MDWQKAEYNQEIYDLAKAKGFSDILAKIIAVRIDDKGDVEDYLNPKIKNLMPNPLSILDVEKGANFLVESIKQKKRIAIFGDYDVDGACSSALIARFLRDFGIDYKIYIPDRIMEGYGPNSAALLSLQAEGYDLVITVDCGTTAFDALEVASKNGLDILVVDHHLSESKIPDAIAVMNPNRFDDTSGLGYLCGAGVSFMLLIAVNKIFKQQNYYQENNLPEPKLFNLLDLVALATICDVVPVVKLNRAFVALGLKLMAQTENIGLRELFQVANIDVGGVKTFHLGYIIGPRINAGGRVGKSTVASELLSTFDHNNIKELSQKLDHYNGERKAIEQIVLEKAFEQIEQKKLYDNNVIIVSNENWHPGVIGIVASRIKDKYNKPAAVIAIENNIGKASARSVEGINLGGLIHSAKAQGLLIAGGGHAMAAGFSVEEGKILALSEFMQNVNNDDIEASCYDMEAKMSDISFRLLDELKILEPFGKNNAEPIFLIRGVMLSKHFLMQEKHLKLILVDKDLGGLGSKVESILWNFDQFDILAKIQNSSFDIICQLKENIWQGNRQLRLDVMKFII
ncbi:MAG: single-stranded-DNA-specific exonuclease RecJ [Rickettsiales bacterium]|jgi:single-stranded-DNA-specific exonuclease|nr:single-stranded-DNA-specific exonuclease RecJ [Rickettsiales bacterium]